MRNEQRSDILWGLGLNETEESQLLTAVRKRWCFRNFQETDPARLDMTEQPKPFMVWIPRRVWQEMSRTAQDAMLDWQDIERVLILEESDTLAEFESAWDRGFLSIVRMPLSRDKVSDVLARAHEVKRLVRDIFRMAQEIELEREMLARKNNQLAFLNRLLSRASESLDTATILTRAFEDLGMLLNIHSLRAAFLRDAPDGSIQADIYRPGSQQPGGDGEWTAYMLECAERVCERRVQGYREFPIQGLRQDDAPERGPRPTDVIVLPLKSAGQAYGCLCLHSDGQAALGRDQGQTMLSAVNHLGLALRNSQNFAAVKDHADYDGLTRIHNRKAFDVRLSEEIRRGARYSNELSLLMLDLDHFKAINDTYGHTTGDTVLREIGALLRSAVRTTDFPARFGGEEFAVILPHTGEDKALALAERLRGSLSAKSFTTETASFTVTASIGVATIRPGGPLQDQDLVKLADAALLAAKASGRNTVCWKE